MKNKNILKIGAGVLLALTFGLLAYIYQKDTGVQLSGRARLDYNWHYIFANSLKHEYKYDGKYISFSYLSKNEKNPLEVYKDDDVESVDAYLLVVRSHFKAPSGVKAELQNYLSSGEKDKFSPSQDFVRWLVGPDEKHYVDKIKRIYLKDGTPAAIVSVKAKNFGLDGDYRYLLLEHKGIVFEIENLSGSSVSNDQYKELLFGRGMEIYSREKQIRPNGARDKQSLWVFRRIIETLEFKQ